MTLPLPNAATLAPDDIEARSFAIIDAEVQPRAFVGHAWEIARRLIHTSGDITLSADLLLPDAAVAAGVAALQRGATIFADTRMAQAGMPLRRLSPLGVKVISLPELLPPPSAHTLSVAKPGITRSRAAMLLAAPRLSGAIVAIGNAPTALLTLLELLDRGTPPPALIIGMPVGFVNAAESKALLAQSPYPSLILAGRKGGSPLAAATINALAIIAGREEMSREKMKGGGSPSCNLS